MKIKNCFSKFVSSFTILALLLVVIAPSIATAAVVTSAKATFGRLKASTANEFGTIEFATPTGIQTGGGDTIILTWSAGFTLAAEVAANYDIELGDSATCSSATYTDEVVALVASATDWGLDITGNVITLSPETDQTLTAGFCMRLVWGTAATTGGTGSASTITNGAVGSTDTIVFTGVFGDTGTITVDIIDDDQVSVTATVNQTITFDIDTAVANGESSTPYTVALGTITTSDVRVSGTTDSINAIWLEGDTNASGGMAVTVANANGANGLVSTAVPADKIPSATTTMAAGTANYGLCIATASLVGWTRATGYVSDTCATNSATNGTRALSTTATAFLNSGGAPLASTSLAEVIVNAENSAITPAHADYTDTLTFVATGTF